MIQGDSTNYITRNPSPQELQLLETMCRRISKGTYAKPSMILRTRLEYYGRTFVLIGKGPSLEFLKREDFPQGAVVWALNHAIQIVSKLEPTAKCIHNDPGPWPTGSIGPVRLLGDKPIPHDSYNSTELGLEHNAATVICALALAKAFKANAIYMVSFDAVTHNVHGVCEKLDKAAPGQYAKQRDQILKMLQTENVYWVTPK